MLDRNKPYSEIGYNTLGIKFGQDGKLFNQRGEEVDTEGNLVVAEELVEEVYYDTMHWSQLKSLIEEDGQKWVNRKHAIDYLKGK